MLSHIHQFMIDQFVCLSFSRTDLEFSLAHSHLQHSKIDTVKNHHFIEMKYPNICSFFVVKDFFF